MGNAPVGDDVGTDPWALLQTERWADAEAAFRAQTDPDDDPESAIGVTIALLHQDRPEEARTLAVGALDHERLTSDLVVPLLFHAAGATLATKGPQATSELLIERWPAGGDDSPMLRKVRGAVRVALGDADGAQEDLAVAGQDPNMRDDQWRILSATVLAFPRPDEALGLVDEIAEPAPVLEEIRAMAHWARADWSAAIAAVERRYEFGEPDDDWLLDTIRADAHARRDGASEDWFPDLGDDSDTARKRLFVWVESNRRAARIDESRRALLELADRLHDVTAGFVQLGLRGVAGDDPWPEQWAEQLVSRRPEASTTVWLSVADWLTQRGEVQRAMPISRLVAERDIGACTDVADLGRIAMARVGTLDGPGAQRALDRARSLDATLDEVSQFVALRALVALMNDETDVLASMLERVDRSALPAGWTPIIAFAEAVAAKSAGDRDDARERLRAIAAESPSEPTALGFQAQATYLLGQMALEDKDFDDATQMFERAYELAGPAALGQRTTALIGIAFTHAYQHDIDDALDIARRARDEADHPLFESLADFTLGVLYRADEQLEAALIAYTKASTGTGPAAPGAVLHLGYVHGDLEDWAAAARCFERAVDLADDVDRVDALIGLGHARSELGEHEAAIDAYRTAMDADGENATARLRLAEEYRTLGRLESARRLFHSAWRSARDQPSAIGYSTTLLQLDRANDAREFLDTSANQLPPSARLEVNRGIALWRTGAHRAARRHWARAVELDPDSPAADWVDAAERHGESWFGYWYGPTSSWPRRLTGVGAAFLLGVLIVVNTVDTQSVAWLDWLSQDSGTTTAASMALIAALLAMPTAASWKFGGVEFTTTPSSPEIGLPTAEDFDERLRQGLRIALAPTPVQVAQPQEAPPGGDVEANG